MFKTFKNVRCKKETTKKYISRPSPPYSANKCLGMKKKGNDGNFYVSTRNVNNVYTWLKKTKTKKVILQ